MKTLPLDGLDLQEDFAEGRLGKLVMGDLVSKLRDEEIITRVQSGEKELLGVFYVIPYWTNYDLF